ncbi:MAG: hypothetical protein OXT65_10935 [Alphaproteobacteria bacterium]|nr:hypothetical protein [Alphaproteobacteria bacterium]
MYSKKSTEDFIDAFTNGDPAGVRAAIEQGADVNVQTSPFQEDLPLAITLTAWGHLYGDDSKFAEEKQDNYTIAKHLLAAEPDMLFVAEGAHLSQIDVILQGDFTKKAHNDPQWADLAAQCVILALKQSEDTEQSTYKPDLNGLFVGLGGDDAHGSQRQRAMDCIEVVHERVIARIYAAEDPLAQAIKAQEKKHSFWTRPFNRPDTAALAHPSAAMIQSTQNMAAFLKLSDSFTAGAPSQALGEAVLEDAETAREHTLKTHKKTDHRAAHKGKNSPN